MPILDGAGLFAGVISHMLSLGDESPKVIAATHFHEIFDFEFVASHAHLTHGHMEVHIDPQSRSSVDQIAYLYK